MRSKSIFFILAITTLFFGCGSPAANTNVATTANVTSPNANSAPANSSGPLNTTRKPEGDKINDAPTLKPVVDAYYDAIAKKDDAAMRKVLAAPFLKVIEADMKSEKKTNLAEFIGETDKVPEGGMQVRNEKISGDEGTAEIKGGVYLNWTALGFVKENGLWKFSNMSPDVQAVDQSKGK